MASAKVWAWFAIFLLALSTVLAAEDFTASGTGRILSYACSPAEGSVTVFNTGTQQSIYTVDAEGPAKEWVLFVPDSFILNPGQSAVIQEYFAVPCDAEDSFMDVVIATEELELLLAQDIVVQTANNLQLIPQHYVEQILPCDTAEFTFLLHNPADFAETYSLKVSESPEQTMLSENKLTLPPGTNETIAVTVHPKDCALAGDFSPVLVVRTEKSRIAAEIEMFLQINDSDIPEIAPGIERIRAGYAPQEASFDIDNLGDRSTTYNLKIEGADWVTVQPSQITVDARDTEKVKFVLQPTDSTSQGKYDVTLTARVVATGKEYTKEFEFVLKKPGLVDDLLGVYLPYTIAGIVALIVLIILIVSGVKKIRSPEFQAKLAERRAERERLRQERLASKEEHRKQREEEKQRKIEEKKDLEEERIRAEEQAAKEAERREREMEKERVRAQRDYDKQLRRENLVINKDDIVAGIKLPGKKLLKLALLLLVLILIGFMLSFRNAIAQNAQAILLGIVVLAIILLLHRLRRRRVARGRWKLALANKVLVLDTKWKRGLTQLSFKLNTVVEKLQVMVKRARPSIPPVAERVYQTFVITPNIDTAMVDASRLKFSVKKSWLLRNRVAPDAVRLLRLFGDHWQHIVAERVSEDAKYVYYVADADGLGEFAITGKPSAKKSKQKPFQLAGWVLPTAFGIVAVIAIAALLIAFPPSTQPKVGIPTQVWTQDTQHTIDLGAYFKDPDNDALAFSSTRTENVEILFIEDKALLTPHYGWSGTERVVFMADDGKGGVVKSNPVDLVVEQNVIPASFKRNAKPVFAVAIVVLLILGAILFRKNIKRMIGLAD